MGRGGVDNQVAGCAGCVVILILLVILIPAKLRTVGPTENGIAYDNIWCTMDEDPKAPGLHWVPAFGSMLTWPSTFQTVEYSQESGNSLTCNSNDGIRIALDITFQYLIERKHIYDLTMTYVDFENYNDILMARGRSALRHGCGEYTAREFQTMREGIAKTLKAEVTAKLMALKAKTIDVQLRNVDRPGPYENAVQAKEAARTDGNLAESEKFQQITLANTELEDAYNEANRTINKARTDAQILVNFGKAEADAVTDRYSTWAETYAAVMSAQELTPQGILAYIGNRLVASSSSATIAMPAPARTSWVDDLATTAAKCDSIADAAAFCGNADGLKADAATLYCAGATCAASLDAKKCCATSGRSREL